MTTNTIRETVFTTVAEVMARPTVPLATGGEGYPLFTLPAGSTIHGLSVDQNGLIEMDAELPTPAVHIPDTSQKRPERP